MITVFYSFVATQWDGFRRFWRFRVAALPKYVAVVPLLFGLTAFYLLAFVGQVQELYMRLLEHSDILRFGIGAFLTGLFGCLLMFAYISLTRHGTITINGAGKDIYISRKALRYRDFCALIVGLLPLAGLFAGMLSMHWTLINRSSIYLMATRDIEAALQNSGQADVIHPTPLLGLPSLADIDMGVSHVHRALPLLILIMILCIVVPFGMAWLWRRSHRGRSFAWCAAFIICAAALIYFPLLDANRLISTTRALGPLAMVMVALISLFSIVMGLIKLTRMIGLPLISLLCAALVTWGFVAPSIRHINDEPPPFVAAESSEWPPQIVKSYWTWLEGRRERIADFKRKGQKFPVYIVSAQGGGIYAASAAATFLANLRDRFPRLTDHLFAVSGVSGGSVGAAVFAAFDLTDASGKPCTGTVGKVRQLIAEDHLSPVLGLLVAEYAEKAFLGLSSRNLAGRLLERQTKYFISRASALAGR